MISLNKCTGSCNALSPKICIQKETKDIYIKANQDKAKAMTEYISYNFKCKF